MEETERERDEHVSKTEKNRRQSKFFSIVSVFFCTTIFAAALKHIVSAYRLLQKSHASGSLVNQFIFNFIKIFAMQNLYQH